MAQSIEDIKKKVAVVGSRTCLDRELVYRVLTKNRSKISLIVSGGAEGADTLAVKWATDYGVPYLTFPALWHDPDTGKFDRSAGYRRNREIVKASDVVLAFWDKKSPGTKLTINIAKELKKPLKIFEFTLLEEPKENDGPIETEQPF
jgi:hypothetical protein